MTTIYPAPAGYRRGTKEGYMKNARQNPCYCGTCNAAEQTKPPCGFSVYVVYHQRNPAFIWALYIFHLLGAILIP